jgi:hypothetical protein
MKFPTGRSFQRLGSFPLDESSVVGTRAQLEDYIANDPRSYAGQIVYVIEENAMVFLDANMEIQPIISEAGISEDQLNDMLNARLDGYSFVKLTKEEFALLSEEEKNDESKLYIIVDTEEIDLSIFATKEDLDEKAPLSHNHETSDIDGLDGIFDNYDSTIAELQEDINGKADSVHSHDETYSKVDHNHGDIYAEKQHKHMTSDITDLNQYLNNRKFNQSQVTDLETTLEGLAEKGHTHNISELDTWLNLSDYAMKTDLNKKVDKVDGKGLSTNDYTTEEKEKLAGVDSLINNAISEASTDAVTEGSAALVTSGAVHAALGNVNVNTSNLVQKSGDTMEGVLVADEISSASLTTVQVRNIVSVDNDPGAGTTSTYPNGTVVLVRE